MQQPIESSGRKKKPVAGETKIYHDLQGEPSFKVTFKDKKIIIERVGEANITREIVPKYGNIRKVDGQMHQAADDALWYLFNLTESN